MECPACHQKTRTAKPCPKCSVFITAKPAGRGQRAWAGVPRRPVNAAEITEIEDGLETGIFDNAHGSYFFSSLSADDDDPRFEDARRAREDGR